MMKRWFLMGLAGVITAATVFTAGAATRSLVPLPDPHDAAYKGADDMETLLYMRDVSSQLQQEHRLILELLDDLKVKIDRLEKKIESSRISS